MISPVLGGEGPAVGDTRFSHKRGFYQEPFNLTISTPTLGAVVRYTTDGSAPTATHGTLYAGPIPITTTTVLRAAAFLAGLVPTNVDTQTYIFLADVIRQPARIPGFPSRWGEFTADYEMDPEVVNDPRYRGLIQDALLAIPTLSIVMDREDLFGDTGVYSNGGSEENGEWERAASVELIYPDGREGFQVDCAIRPHSHVIRKRSFKLLFKSENGESKLRFPLFESAPLNAASSVREFDRLVLRAGTNRSWAFPHNFYDTCYTRDQWVRDSQIAMSGIGSHGTFVHLHLNGLYWGLYNPVERPDHWFTSAYIGGDEDDWFAINHGGVINGDSTRYDRMLQIAGRQALEEPGRYDLFRQYLNVTHYSDYIILNFYAGTGDWPQNNWYGGNRTAGARGEFLFFSWDGEDIFDALGSEAPGRSNDGAWVNPRFRRVVEPRFPINQVWRALTENQDYMTLFADRVYQHCFNDGALTEKNARERWLALNRSIEKAILGESARWGDALEDLGIPVRTVDDHWRPEVDRVADVSIRGNPERLIEALRAEGYYPQLDPPIIRRHGGLVPPGFELILINPKGIGVIHYTLDGSDPRAEVSGAVSDSAEVYSFPVTLTRTTLVKARVRSGGEWSALAQASFYTPQDLVKLRLTEIMYHHPDFSSLDGDNYDFIELKNTGTLELDLSGVRFTEGISYAFPFGARLQPGEIVVLASNPEEFALRYPEARAGGAYTRELTNSGATVTLSDFAGNTISTVTYGDDSPWPVEADGDGFSLVPVSASPVADQADAAEWRRSGDLGGSPGADDGPSQRAAPRIARQPEDVLVSAGEPAVFTVWALGQPQPAYQWEVNGQEIPGATDWYHAVPSVTVKDHGRRFRCRVRNAQGSIMSAEATILLNTPRRVSGALVTSTSTWRYLKGREEASSPPGAWRLSGFDESSWPEGAAPFGYGDPPFGTFLGDMKDDYSSVYFRRRFRIPDGLTLTSLHVNANFDDGVIVWINGVEVVRSRVAPGEPAHDTLASRNHESGEYLDFALPDPAGYIVTGENVIAAQAFNLNLDSSDFYLDLELVFEGLGVATGAGSFVRGDSNGDGAINISDGIFMLLVLFLGFDAGDCIDALDANDDGTLNLTDPVAILGFLFVGGSRPPAPFPLPGTDTTFDLLDCEREA